MAELSVRRADAADASALAQMEKECFSDPWDALTFERILANPSVYFFIAETDGRMIAYSGMTVVIDECDIVNIAVANDMRRRGIGKMLVENIINICKKLCVKNVFLEHRVSNTAAAALYEKFGFIPYGTRRRYYTSPVEDAVLRSLTL